MAVAGFLGRRVSRVIGVLIWYAAYGSNLLKDRFLTYLRGGEVPGSGRHQHGARDGSDPVDDQPYRFDRPLGFGRESRGWGGRGVCFVDPDRTVPGDTLGRAWLITDEQLADVWAQENGTVDGPAIDVEALVTGGSLDLDLGRGWYRRLECLGSLDGHPVATITCDSMPEPNAAGMAYLEVVGRGLIETWGMPAGEAADYLASRRGNVGQIDRSALEALLAASR